ncbi:MAG TPA: NAD(P)H-dependent oxidoreductase subunit E [Bacteroidota bacterium]|nr:NAD(P)H-dependent oxidoreductase subunit E [Bacteroidota bacterium]
MFSPENLKRVEDLRQHYPHSQALVLPVLWLAQEQFGSISTETMRYVADLLRVPFSHILGVVTFYTMFHQKPTGKHHIEVCTNISCMLRGSGILLQYLEQKLGIKAGETTADGKWTISEVECMGACGGAPMCAVGEDYHENLTTEKLDRVLAGLEKH